MPVLSIRPNQPLTEKQIKVAQVILKEIAIQIVVHQHGRLFTVHLAGIPDLHTRTHLESYWALHLPEAEFTYNS